MNTYWGGINWVGLNTRGPWALKLLYVPVPQRDHEQEQTTLRHSASDHEASAICIFIYTAQLPWLQWYLGQVTRWHVWDPDIATLRFVGKYFVWFELLTTGNIYVIQIDESDLWNLSVVHNLHIRFNGLTEALTIDQSHHTLIQVIYIPTESSTEYLMKRDK